MAKVRNLNYDGVGHNADWVASFKTEKQFVSRQELQHLYPDKSAEARTQAFKEVYTLCREMVNPGAKPAANSDEKPGGE